MRKFSLATLLILAASAGAPPAPAGPQMPGASGPEFQVNSPSFPPRYSYSYRFGPAADLADGGEFLVVWATWQGGGLGAMTGRAFDSNGTPFAGEFDLGDGAIFHYFPESPDVDFGGNQFVVVWTSYEIGAPIYGYSVKAQRFDTLGGMLGPRLTLSPAYGEFYGEVAVESGGDFIVVWDDISFARARRFTSSGEPSWPQQTVSPGDEGRPDPDVAVDTLGNFTVAWSFFDITGPDTILAQRFDSSGAPLASEFAVSQPHPTLDQPAIAARPDGGFVAAWRGGGVDGSGTGILGRIFDGSLQPLGNEFVVNASTLGHQEKADVAVDDRGNFVVVWDSGSQYRRGDVVVGQRFDAGGNRVGAEFQISVDLTTGQRLPSIGMRGDGEFVVTWFSKSPLGSYENTVRARRFCSTPNVTAPATLSVCEDEPVQLSVQATGREPFSHQWRKDALPLFDDGRISGSTGPTLGIAAASLDDAGAYDCQVTDACEGPQSLLTTPAQLQVNPLPGQAAGLTVTTEDAGATLRFTWSPAGAAADYVVRSDLVPGGGFGDVTGTSSDPATGLAVPMPPETRFFLVAGRNPLCGEGPLR